MDFLDEDVTALLRAWKGGNDEALEDLIPVVYRELPCPPSDPVLHDSSFLSSSHSEAEAGKPGERGHAGKDRRIGMTGLGAIGTMCSTSNGRLNTASGAWQYSHRCPA